MVEASFSSGKSGLLMDFPDLGVEVLERRAEWAWQAVVGWQQGRPLGPQDAEIQLRAEKGPFSP